MEKRTQGRYSLVVTSTISHRSQTIPFMWDEELEGKVNEKKLDEAKLHFSGKEKLPLSLIDAFTTQFENKDALLSYLFTHVEGVCDGKVTIDYSSNGRIKHLGVAFADQTEIKELSTRNFNNSGVEQSNLKLKLISSLANNLDKDRKIFNYLKESGYADYKTSELIADYMDNVENSNYRFHEKKLVDALSYKTFRGIAMGMKDYDSNDYLEEVVGNKQIKRSFQELTETKKQPTIEELKALKESLEGEINPAVKPPVVTTMPLFVMDPDPVQYTSPHSR